MAKYVYKNTYWIILNDLDWLFVHEFLLGRPAWVVNEPDSQETDVMSLTSKFASAAKAVRYVKGRYCNYNTFCTRHKTRLFATIALDL